MFLAVSGNCLVRLVVGFATIVFCLERIPSSFGQNHYKHNSISKYYSYKHGISGCLEPSIEVRERNASAIFTGTIRDLEPDNENPEALKATVEVKRVMKGGHILSRLPHAPYGGDSWKTVIVEGIGNGKICRSFARKHDTRIFLVNKGINGELKLNSSLERITLSNIEKIESAVKGENNVLMTSTPTTRPSGHTSGEQYLTEFNSSVFHENYLHFVVVSPVGQSRGQEFKSRTANILRPLCLTIAIERSKL